MSSKMLIVLKHEFLQKVRSKGYIIFTLLGPVLMASLFVIPAILASVDTGDKRVIAIVDQTGKIAPYYAKAKSSMTSPPTKTDGNRDDLSIAEQSEPPGLDMDIVIASPIASIDSLKALVDSDILTGFLVIPATAMSDSAAERAVLRLRNTNDFAAVRQIENVYEEALRNEKLSAKGVDPKILTDIEALSNIRTVKVSAGQESDDQGGTFLAGYLTGFLMYMSLLIYGSMILRSVVEEKSTRVMEVMVSSVRPYDLLLGKVLGITAAALIQMTVWSAMMAILATIGVSFAEKMMGSNLGISIPPELFAYFVIYFVLGFLIYATLYAMVGATADQESDSQQASFPITMLVIIPIILMTSVIQSPSSTMSTVLSFVPFFTPILMMGRVFSETPPFWQIALSIAIMIGTFLGVLWIASRIYRVGILMYGKRFTPKEVIKWLRYS